MRYHDELVKYYGKLQNKDDNYDSEEHYHEDAYYFASEKSEFLEAEGKIMVFPKWIVDSRVEDNEIEYLKVRSKVIEKIFLSYGIKTNKMECKIEDNPKFSLEKLGEEPNKI